MPRSFSPCMAPGRLGWLSALPAALADSLGRACVQLLKSLFLSFLQLVGACAAGFLFCALRWPRGVRVEHEFCARASVRSVKLSVCTPWSSVCAAALGAFVLCRCVGAACVLAGCVAVHLVRSRAFGSLISLRSLVPRD